MSKPFWSTKRETSPMRGTSGSALRPASRWSGRLFACRRIDLVVVDAVEHPEQPVLAVAEEWVQLLSVLRREYLLSVAFAHRGDDVREVDAPGHEVDDVGQLAYLRMVEEAIGVDPGDLEDPAAEDPLVLEVVDGVDGCRVAEEGVVSVDGLEPVGNYARVPVVAVDDVWLPLEVSEHLECPTAVEHKALAVVRIAVDAFPVEVPVVADEIDRHVLAHRRPSHRDELRRPVHWHLEVRQRGS